MTLRPCLVLLASLFAALGSAQTAPQKLQDVEICKRDYGGNIPASDRNAYYANNSTSGTLPAVEYDVNPGGTGQVSGVVFTRGTSSTTLAVTIRNDNSFPVTGKVRFVAAKLTEPDANGNEDAASAALTVSPTGEQNLSLAALGGKQTMTLTISGLPNSVALGHLAVSYDMPLQWTDEEGRVGHANDGTNGNFEQWERLFVVDGAPVGLQAVPWTDFLEASCRWAFGAAGQADMREKMVKGMRYSSRSPNHKLYYNYSLLPKYVPTASQSNPNPNLRLKKFVVELDAWDTQYSTEVSMQCADWAATLNLAFASQGYVAMATAYYAKATDMNGGTIDVDFKTNPLIAAPYNDQVTTDYNRTPFRYHAIVSGTVDQASVRFDASNSYLYDYNSGGYWKKPVTGWLYPAYLFGVNNNGFGLIESFVLPQGATYQTMNAVDFTPLALVNN